MGDPSASIVVYFYNDRIEASNDFTGTQKTIHYADIVTKDQIPTVPTKTSQLTNDSGYQTASDVSTAVSTAISNQTKETWTFVLSNGSTVTKSVVLG